MEQKVERRKWRGGKENDNSPLVWIKMPRGLLVGLLCTLVIGLTAEGVTKTTEHESLSTPCLYRVSKTTCDTPSATPTSSPQAPKRCGPPPVTVIVQDERDKAEVAERNMAQQRFLVSFASNVPQKEVDQACTDAEKAGATLVHQFTATKGFVAVLPEEAQAILRRNVHVTSVQPDKDVHTLHE